MKKLSVILIVAGGLVCCSIGKADITGVYFADDGDGVVSCPVYVWGQTPEGDTDATPSSDVIVSVDGTQNYLEPGHVVGNIYTDTTGDPSLTLDSAIDNETGSAWTAFDVNVYMDNTFSLSTTGVTVPAGWTVTSIQSNAVPVVGNEHGTYEASMVFTGGTPVAISGELDFAYTINGFSGNTLYSFTQEMIPVPEPGTFGFLAAGALLLGGFLAAGRRKSHS